MEIQEVLQEWFISFVRYLPKLISGIVLFILTLVGSGYFAKMIQNTLKKKVSNQEMLALIYRITRWTVLIIGTILALNQVNFDVTGFIAGLGVVGFTIGFALQDIAKNFISGLLLLYRQPFNLGERVLIADYGGVVKEINVRDTVIETLDGELVIIPNREVFENPIINLTHSRLKRRTIVIGLGYDQDVERAEKLFLESIKSTPGVETEPPPSIRAESLGDSALMVEALFWIDQQKHNFLLVHSRVLKAILKTSEENNINLPYPVQTVLVKTLDE